MWCVGFVFAYCFTAAPAGAADDYCQIAAPIFWSAQDTRATKAAVDRHNRVWKAICAKEG